MLRDVRKMFTKCLIHCGHPLQLFSPFTVFPVGPWNCFSLPTHILFVKSKMKSPKRKGLWKPFYTLCQSSENLCNFL